LPAEDDVKASLLKPAINVPHVQNVREWLPDVRPQFTPYHGGCMSDVLTLLEDECVVPLAVSGTFVGDDLAGQRPLVAAMCACRLVLEP
jgi:hypothetical protein